MPEMTLSFDYTLRALSGRSMEFKAGEPAYVIPENVAEAQAVGAVDSAHYAALVAVEAPPEAVADPIADPV